MKLNKIHKVWNSANRLLSDYSLLSSKNFATMVMWLNDFFSLLHSQIDKYYIEYFATMYRVSQKFVHLHSTIGLDQHII